MLIKGNIFVTTESHMGGEYFATQLNFSTAIDVERGEFFTETEEHFGHIEETQLQKSAARFRLVDGELFVVDEENLPPNARGLTEDAGIFRIIGLGR